MRSNLRSKWLFVAAVVLLSTAVSGYAQDLPTITTIKNTVSRYGQSYTVNIEYDYLKAIAGSDYLEINVSIETLGKNLKLVSCERCDPNSSVFSHMSGPTVMDPGQPSATNGISRAKYRFVAGIKKDTKPKEYNVDLRFEPPDVAQWRRTDPQYSDIFVGFPLYVGVLQDGLLSVLSKPKPESCSSGQLHPVTLMLHNDFPNYTINVQKLIVTASPTELLDGVVVPATSRGKVDGTMIVFDPPVSIAPFQEESLRFNVQMAGMSAGNYLLGFDPESQLNFSFIYDDGKGRRISDYTYTRGLHLQPRLLVLAVAVLLGISVGVFLMFVWKMLVLEGTGLRKGMAVATTVVIALVVSILAMQGELNVSFEAFKLRASYDKPLMLFVFSLFATVLGTPILRKAFGLDKQPDSVPSSPAT
jgi:hypothetical protein